jgi:two-component system LytT family sensor kinase
MNPHFLFNTLHAISALVERDPAGVRRMIARLSELLRHTLETRADQEVPLREEMSFINRYLEIMQVRFQGKLHIEQNIDPAAAEALVPTLILQPIVENALEHGVNRAKGDGRIAIEARIDDEVLVISVRDNGPGLEDPATRDGVGLGNSRARLEQLYGDEASIALRSLPDEGVLAEIRLPFHTAADLRVQSSDDEA